MYERYLWIGVILLLCILVVELWRPQWARTLGEGFENWVSVGNSPFWTKWMPRRGDISLDIKEEDGYLRETRYFAGYADVQRIGQDHDFCRMVESTTDPEDVFFACALAGTDGLSSIRYRTLSKKDGLLLSRDDYMNDVLKEGRQGYCRILKTGPDTFEAKCHPAGDTSFSTTSITDTAPPPAIQTLLLFYEGISFWLRCDDDLLDYAKNLVVAKAGDIEIDETPRPPVTEGLGFNGVDQFLRLGDSKDLTFGQTVQLRYLRAVSFWVYFEEFTNNAHVFDFGNGAGKDNVFVGIIGRGNAPATTATALQGDMESPLVSSAAPAGACSSGAATEEVSPQRAMATSAANVNRWDCPMPELFGRMMPPTDSKEKAAEPHEATTADLLYEIWDEKQRKLHIQVKNAIPLRKWVHIVISADDNDPWRPRLRIYRNGEEVHKEEAGWLPQTNDTTHNYIGKSNWMSQTSPYANADELFKGRIFDFRGYRTMMGEKKVQATYQWGKDRLGLSDGKDRLGLSDGKDRLGLSDDLSEEKME
jgi:Concanavalin A-like lectin/glucanases superfamily